MRRTKQIVFITIIFIFFLLPFTRVLATDIDTKDYNPDNISIKSESAILIDSNTGQILYSKNAYEKLYPASTTKLMTAILTLENCKLTDVCTVSHNAIYSIPVGYTHANLVEGEELTVEQLLNVLLIPSANDAAIVLAEHIAGSVENFSTMMNNKAKELGCLNTHFVNPNGIHNENHYSTAYDMSLIGRYSMKFDDIMRIVKVTQYTLPKTNKYNKEDRIFNTTNGLINPNDEYYYEYTTGLKTGYTDKAGSCIVSTAKKDNLELMAVVLKSETVDDRNNDCINLFNYGFNNYSYQNIVNKGETVNTVKVENATSETERLNVLTKDNITALVKNTVDMNNIQKKIEINDNLTAPIAKDAVIGNITYTLDNKTYSTELIAQNSVEEINIKLIIYRILLILFIFIIFIFIISKLNKPKNSRKKGKSNNYSSKKSSSKTRKKSKHGGRYKFTQIHDYL